MANFLCYVLLGVICMVFQSTILVYMSFRMLRVDLMIVILTFVALFHPLVRGCLLVTLLGYLYDLNSASPLGLHSMTFLLCFITLYLIRNRLLIQGPLFCISLVAFMVFFHELLQVVLLTSRGLDAWPTFYQLVLLIPKAILTGFFWIPLVKVMKKINKVFPLPFLAKTRTTGLQFDFR